VEVEHGEGWVATFMVDRNFLKIKIKNKQKTCRMQSNVITFNIKTKYLPLFEKSH